MWEGLLMLLFLSIIMGAASFLAGSLPLSFALSSRKLRLISAIGTGVLVGTSLIVIIPEGIDTLYTARGPSHTTNHRALRIRAGESIASLRYEAGSLDVRAAPVPTLRAEPVHTSQVGAWHESRDVQDRGEYATTRRGSEQDSTDQSDGGSPDDGAQHDRTDFEPHTWIGIALILGFILMYLIDTLPQTTSPSSRPQRFHISLNQFSFNRFSSTTQESSEAHISDTLDNEPSDHSSPRSTSRPTSTTVGLVIHAAADGIALGASSTTSSNRLSFIIFIALMIHKAPAAFGLTSVLLKQGLSKRMARTHLIVFSLAAPVGALLTWSAVHLLGLSSDDLSDGTSTEFVTGVLLLFSGGTFLYVAMHTMQESGGHLHDESHTNGYVGVSIENPYATHSPTVSKSANPVLTDTLVTVLGMLLPLLTQFGHGH